MCRGKSLAMEAGGEGAGAGHRFIGREASDAVGQPLGRPAVTPTRCPVASALLASRGTGAARLFQETREVSQRSGGIGRCFMNLGNFCHPLLEQIHAPQIHPLTPPLPNGPATPQRRKTTFTEKKAQKRRPFIT